MVCRLRRTPGSVQSTTEPTARITTLGKVGARHLKEVASVSETNSSIKAQSPRLGVSAYGQTSFEAGSISAFGGAQVSTCVRVRHIGDMGLAATTGFPGTSAWRPPTC